MKIYKNYICWDCERVIRVGYTVPSYIWKMLNLCNAVCLNCLVHGLYSDDITQDFEIKIHKGS